MTDSNRTSKHRFVGGIHQENCPECSSAMAGNLSKAQQTSTFVARDICTECDHLRGEIARLTASRDGYRETASQLVTIKDRLVAERDRLQERINWAVQELRRCSQNDHYYVQHIADTLAGSHSHPSSESAGGQRHPDETSGPLKMICNRHGAIIETGCPECEAKVLLRERHAMNGSAVQSDADTTIQRLQVSESDG